MSNINDVIGENLLFLFDNCSAVSDYIYVFNKLVVTFDSHYLNFIKNRKERDGYIIFRSLAFMLNECESGFLKNKHFLSSMFEIKDLSLDISPDLYPVNIGSTSKNIITEVSMMKAIHAVFVFFFNNAIYKKTDNMINLKENIDIKINKVANLSDKSILQRVTTNEDFINRILSEFGGISFEEVLMDNLYYNNIINDINTFLAKQNKR